MKAIICNRNQYGSCTFISLFLVQVLSGKIGSYFSDIFSYSKIDSYDVFAAVSIHHIVQMTLILIIIAMLSKNLKIDFCLKLGDVKKGTKYLAVFTAVFTLISVIIHIIMYADKQLPIYNFPLNARNILGTLSFQLLLSGPAEEIVYRALPITMLVYAFGKSISVNDHITLEVILASILFSFAHIKWTLIPFNIEVDFLKFLYSFMLGTIQGIVYQKSKSILYPILMHSFSNVLMVGMGYLFIWFL